MIFADTSAYYAVADRHDAGHAAIRRALAEIAIRKETVFTHAYVLVETAALLHARLGRDAASAFLKEAAGFDVEWPDRDQHEEAATLFEREGSRGVSFVDCAAFTAMRRRGCREALTLDQDYVRQGFTILPGA